MGVLLIFFISYLILNATLLTVAIAIAFLPNFWGLLLALGGPPLFASALIGLSFLVAPDLSDMVEMKTAYLACAMGFVAGIAGYFFIPDYIDLMRTPHVEAIPVVHARDHGGAGYRGYVKGRLRADLTFHHVVHDTDSEGNPTETRYSGAPVTPVPGQAGVPFPLVAVAIGDQPFNKWVEKKLPLQGMLVRSDRYHRKTLALAREAGVRIAGDAVLVRLEERGHSKLLESKRTWSWVIVGGANMVWFFVALFWISNLRRYS